MLTFRSALTLALLFSSTFVFARAPYLGYWGAIYPESTSDDAACQLCHVSSNGGSPWNAYGWEIRDAWNNGLVPIEEAIEAVEFEDHDNDPSSADSIDEIAYGLQPGWKNNDKNIWYNANNTTVTDKFPPEDLASNELDFPEPVVQPIPGAIAVAAETLDLAEVAVEFNAPVRAVKAPGIDGSLFVVEQTGKIIRVDLASGTKTLFHDVSSSLVDINPNYDERGLLGLAFHPNYHLNGLFYTYQSEPVRATDNDYVDFTVGSASLDHRSMIVEYKASDPSCNSYIRKKKTLMVIDQPQSNHNGGDLVFDQNSLLYVALGDGGLRNDQGPGHGLSGNGRNKKNVLGTILRIDPLGSDPMNAKYGIPPSNPFTGSGDEGVDEVFAYGFRNPYRMSIDAQDGVSLYTGDVGQKSIEEINHVIGGGNYGWNWKEGSLFFYHHANTGSSDGYVSNIAPPDLPNDLQDPIGEYGRDEGISVIGGYVYRGSSIANTSGSYVFGEFASPDGKLRKLDIVTGDIKEFPLMNSIGGFVTGFGQDADNELYVTINNSFGPGGTAGKLLKLVEAGDVSSPPVAMGESAMCPPDESICVPIKTTNNKIATICL